MMHLLALLFVTRAGAEWVEISQQHYRKPIRTHSAFTTPDKDIHVEETTKPWTYSNRSVTEYNWNKNPARPPNIGNKRVHIETTAKTIEKLKFEDEDLDLDFDVIDYELPRIPTKTTAETHERGKQKGTIERVANVANIKRVQLSNTPVKSPATNLKDDRDKHLNNRHDDGPHEAIHHTVTNEFEHKNNSARRIYVNKLKKHTTERTATFPPDNDGDTFTEELTTFNTKRLKQEYSNHTRNRHLYSTKPTFVTETEDFSNYETEKNRFFKITNSKTDIFKEFPTETIDTEEIVARPSINNKPTPEKPYKINFNKHRHDFEESLENKVHTTENKEKHANLMDEDYKQIIKVKNNQRKPEHHFENKNEADNFKENQSRKGEIPSNAETDTLKVNTLDNVIKFMRVVTDTISRNSKRSFGGKMQYLHELKDSILTNIEDRIDATWPDDDSAGTRRRSRSAHASARGHVQFPSSESALMTISFLTFAVFLIKLVLQVIHTYKQKTMMVAPVMVASGRRVFTHFGHH